MSGSEKEYRAPVERAEGTDHHESHHHHEHRESRHHQSRQKKKRRSNNKMVNYIRDHRKQLAGVAVFLVILIVLIVLIFMESAANRDAEGQLLDGTGATSDRMQQVELTPLTMQLPWLPEAQSLVGDAAQALLDADPATPADQVLASFRETGDRLDAGLPVVLSFDVVSVPMGETIDSFRVELWQTGDPDGVQSYELKANQRSLELTSLKTGAQYQYRILVFLSGGTSHGIVGTFETAVSPRILSIPGIRNVRDIGGWETVDGKTIRQGLLYRGSEMDGAVEDELLLTDDGQQDMLTKLGIRTDMDLRSEGEGYGALGANVRHTYYDVPFYDGIFTEEGGAAVRKVFEDLSDPKSYPVYLHCTYGTDRTGTICCLLEALLGLSEEDLIREYELSALAYDAADREQIQSTIDRLESWDGADIQEDVELYLQSVGVTQAQIEQIRSIFLQ